MAVAFSPAAVILTRQGRKAPVTLPTEALRQEILALQPDLRAFAGRLTTDDVEAERLVDLTLTDALGDRPVQADDDERDTRQWLYGLLRGAFHSVERRRDQNRRRGAPVVVWNPSRAAAYAAPVDPLA